MASWKEITSRATTNRDAKLHKTLRPYVGHRCGIIEKDGPNHHELTRIFDEGFRLINWPDEPVQTTGLKAFRPDNARNTDEEATLPGPIDKLVIAPGDAPETNDKALKIDFMRKRHRQEIIGVEFNFSLPGKNTQSRAWAAIKSAIKQLLQSHGVTQFSINCHDIEATESLAFSSAGNGRTPNIVMEVCVVGKMYPELAQAVAEIHLIGTNQYHQIKKGGGAGSGRAAG